MTVVLTDARPVALPAHVSSVVVLGDDRVSSLFPPVSLVVVVVVIDVLFIMKR